MWPFSSSDEEWPEGAVEYGVTFESRKVTTIRTERYYFVSGRSETYSYDTEKSSRCHDPRLVDFDGENVRTVNWANVENVDHVEDVDAAYWHTVGEHRDIFRTEEEIEELRDTKGVRNVQKTGSKRIS